MDTLSSSLALIAKKIHDIQIKREERLIATKGRFNIFTTLLQAHDESRLHSRFIYHLLNPRGNHDCGNLFLKSFINSLLPLIKEKTAEESLFENISDADFKYGRTEHPTAKGRAIDIYLEFKNKKDEQIYKIAIENKIYAKEQNDQIADYSIDIKSDKINNFLFYLTLDGKKSDTAFDKDTEKEVIYFCISYKDHILAWLDQCLQDTYRYVNINQVIQQYQDVVKQLTHQTMENEDMCKIKEIIKENPEVLKYQVSISNAVLDLKREWLDSLWGHLFRLFKLQENVKPEWMQRFKAEYVFLDQYINVSVEGEIERVNFLIEVNWTQNFLKVGLCTHNYDNDKKELIYNEIKKKEGCDQFGEYDNAWWVLGEKVIERNIYDNEFIANHLSEDQIESLAEKIHKEVIFFIENVQKWWDEA